LFFEILIEIHPEKERFSMSEKNMWDGLVFHIFRRWRGFSIFEAREVRGGICIPLWVRGMPNEAKKVETITLAILAAASEADQPFRIYYTVPRGVENGHRDLLYPLDRKESAIARAIVKANKKRPTA